MFNMLAPLWPTAEFAGKLLQSIPSGLAHLTTILSEVTNHPFLVGKEYRHNPLAQMTVLAHERALAEGLEVGRIEEVELPTYNAFRHAFSASMVTLAWYQGMVDQQIPATLAESIAIQSVRAMGSGNELYEYARQILAPSAAPNEWVQRCGPDKYTDLYNNGEGIVLAQWALTQPALIAAMRAGDWNTVKDALSHQLAGNIRSGELILNPATDFQHKRDDILHAATQQETALFSWLDGWICDAQQASSQDRQLATPPVFGHAQPGPRQSIARHP
jgi:hypothetical protein